MTMMNPSPWYRRIGEPIDSAENVIWFPHAGGGASALIRQSRQVSLPVNLFAATLPGREGRFGEAMPDSLAQLTAILADELPSSPSPPVLLGHSFGALLAYGVAQSRATGGLVVAAMLPPDQISQHDSISHLGNVDFAEQLDRRYGGIPRSFRENEEAMQLFLPTVRHDLRLMESYRDDGPWRLDVPILALAGSQDGRANAIKMQGWKNRTDRSFSIQTLPGDHFFPLAQLTRVLQLARLCFDTSD